MDIVPEIILRNPFRVLGVYANSRRQEILANKSKATAFLKVNKLVEFPLDLKGILPTPNRTLDLMNEAEAHLAIAKEQIKYAQFWFLQKMSPLDDVAFNHLIAGDMAGAKEIWSRQESQSSLQNKLVCCLIEDNIGQALSLAERLYEKFGDTYINKVDANCTLQMTGTELLHQFIDSLGQEVGMQKLLGYELGTETKAYISTQTVGPLINKITSEVDKAKKVDRKDPNARKEAGQKLMVATKEPLKQLKSILSVSDPQYVMIADKLGSEILQCGIDYYNNSNDDDAAFNAMPIQKYASSIVVGALAVGRCKENVEILQKIIDKLPPKEISREYNLLMEIIADFVNPPKKETPEGVIPLEMPRRLGSFLDSIVGPSLPDNSSSILSFIKSVRPLVVAMKEKVDRNESHYVEICTLVGNVAISKSVESLNKAQEVLSDWGKRATNVVNNPYDLLNSRNLNAISHYNSLLTSFKSMVANTWEALSLIELMDVSNEFRTDRLNPNKIALKSIGTSAGLSLANTAKDPTFFYTEQDCYRACNNYTSYANFIEKFPKGKYYREAKEKMVAIEKRDFERCSSVSSYEGFIKKYPKSSFIQKAKDKIEELNYHACKKYNDYREFLKKYSNGLYSDKAKEKINSIEGEIKQNLTLISTVEGCCSLYRKYDADPGGKIDEKAYSLCETHDDLTAYAKTFMSRRDDARKRIEGIERKRMFIGFAIAAAILLLIIILANSN